MKTQFGQLVTGDFGDNTMTFEIEGEMTLQAGRYALVPIDEYNQLVKKCDLADVIERFDVKMPRLYGNLKNIEFKTTGNDKVKHHWCIMHGVRTFAGKEPFQIHLGRTVL